MQNPIDPEYPIADPDLIDLLRDRCDLALRGKDNHGRGPTVGYYSESIGIPVDDDVDLLPVDERIRLTA
jgi:hypothetical protein